jgi:hypothetical protein
VSGETVLVDLGNPDVQDLALDRDGNYVAVQSGQLAIVSRQTGQVTTFDTDHYEGEMTALAVDAETNRCWVATTTTTAFEDNVLIEYDLDDGPGPGVLLASLSFNGHMNFINGLAYDGTDSLYLGGNDFFDAPRLLRYTLSTGQITDVAPALPEISIAGVHVDLRTGELHFAETAAPLFPASWYVVDPEVGVATPVATWAPAQEYARALDLNDWIDRTALFPRHASASASTLVEMSAHGLPGELGYLAVVAINGSPIAPLIVGTGFMNSGGYYALSATLSPGMLPAGLSFTLISARRDLTTGHVTIGTQAELSVGP